MVTARQLLMFTFPGQGSQHVRMAIGLYGTEPGFTAAFDRVIDHYGADGAAAREDWLAAVPDSHMDRPSRSQLLLFAIDYALGRAMLERGHVPSVMLGHSIGEVAAACLAGVMSLADVADLIRHRMRQLEDAPAGGMLAVAGTPEQVRAVLTDDVVIGAFNAPRQVVLAGPSAPLNEAAARLTELGLSSRRIPSQTGFHSPMLAEYAAMSIDRIRRIHLTEPTLQVYSCYRPGSLDAYALQPEYWASHPVAPVRFWDALDAALIDSVDPLIVIELGPGGGLTTLVRRHPTVRSGHHRVVSALPTPPTTAVADRETWGAMLDSIA